MRQLRLEVLTPQGTVFDAPVDAVVAPLPDGWIGILPGHTSFQARLLAGVVALRTEGRRRLIATLGGVLSVESDLVSILTGGAMPDAELEGLEEQIGEQAERAQAVENEAEKHFGRVYRALADTLNRRRARV
ncbi:MAG TPA: F0F1 ATP synthase subunit epsilon [Chloroflexota bacterium]|jgi:F-type H+-transporting ATPase subunit epsilon